MSPRNMDLVLPSGYQTLKNWNGTLCRMLAESGLFRAREKDFAMEQIRSNRSNFWSMLELDGCKIGLDTWDTYYPTSTFLQDGLFRPGGLLAELDLLLKIQYYPCKFWEEFSDQTKIPVRPWTVMPSAGFPLGKFRWQRDGHKYLATPLGRNNRFKRQTWVDWCRAQPDFHAPSDYSQKVDLPAYLEILQACRWGLILKGLLIHHDGKNRRECEFASLGMPLALTYQPTYPFPMEPGKHFVFVRRPGDLAKLRDIDPVPYARASRQLYDHHFSPVGAARTLISLIHEL